MSLPKRIHEILWGALLVSLFFLDGSSATMKPSQQTWGDTVNGLQLSLYFDGAEHGQSKSPNFRVELRNSGENDAILNLGLMLANGRKQYPNAIVLNIVDSQGKSQRLVLEGPWFVAGRVDPLVVPIPTNSTFSIAVDLEKYEQLDTKLKPGTYTIAAQFAGKGVSQQEANLDVKGIALMPYWQGTVTSNQMKFEIPNR